MVEIDWVERLSGALGVERCGQDWGITNADPARVVEFIQFYESHAPNHPWEFEALAELILASADDGCRKGTLGKATESTVKRFVQDHHSEFPQQWEYWSKLDPRGFPVVALLGGRIDDKPERQGGHD